MTDSQYFYLGNAKHYLSQVMTVWGEYFDSKANFHGFFNDIDSDREKDLFLRVGSFYRYLVIEGTYGFAKPEWNKGMPFIDDTYKFLAIFSLIEALEAPSEHLDFYEWLQKTKRDETAGPDVKLVAVLEPMYREYKVEYGSRQAAVRFFSRLDEPDQRLLQQNLQISGKDPSIRKLAQLLYDMRSEFVHEARFILDFGTLTSVGTHGGEVLVNNLTMTDMRAFFEHGFLKRFGFRFKGAHN